MSTADLIGLFGIQLAVGLLILLAYRGFSLLLAAPAAALLATAFGGEPLLAHWTETLMGGVGRFRAVLPTLPARRRVRQAHGRQRVRPCDRAHGADHEYFICGPDVMMDTIEKALGELKVPLSKYHSERYRFV